MIYAIAIGSNSISKYGSPINTLKLSLRLIEDRNIKVIKKSSLYLSPPKDFNNAASSFYNAAIVVNTSLRPKNLLRELKKIEALMGRHKHKKNTSRTCDLDIILQKSNEIIKDNDPVLPCFIPHLEMCHRNFVIKPLLEICPNWRHPVKEVTVSTIAKDFFLTDKLYKILNVL